MPTVFSSEPAEYDVERSRFIGKTFRLTHGDGVSRWLGVMQETFPAANHYTWAYRISSTDMRASDHGEPHGTAGMPMLNILTREDWVETLVIVVRYFGGIKLGRGGLVHAYQRSAHLALQKTVPGELRRICRAEVKVDYSLFERLRRGLDPLLLDQEALFGADVAMTLTLGAENWDSVEKLLQQEAHGRWMLVNRLEEWRLMPIISPHSG